MKTKEDTPITIRSSTLLANDRDANGDPLKITRVSNASNGYAVLDSKGNIIFSPNDNFYGNASFQYTVNDGRGGKAKATVTVSVLDQPEPVVNPINMGTNLYSIVDWSTQQPFLDAFKSSRQWLTHNKATWDTNEDSKLNLDSNGWVKSLPTPGDGSQYTSVGTLMLREIGGKYPGGKYVVLYDGQGTIEYSFDGKKDVAASRLGRDVINVTPTNDGIWLNITATDPYKTGDYIRNIRVVPIEYENTYQTQIFNPKFIEKIDDFSALRFMDWMETNHSAQSQWNTRPTTQSARYSQQGASVEVMVELANRIDADPWFTMPHQASDDYVLNFASYVKLHLEPGRKVYVEFTNEGWNSDFSQNRWILEQANNAWGNNGDADTQKIINWFSKRTTEITQIWDNVFGADKERVIGVMGAQAANIGVAEQALSYDWTSTPLSHQEYGIDAVAIGHYFGHYIGTPTHAAEVENWTRDADGELNKLFDEITKGGVLSGGPTGGALQQANNWMESHVELTQKEGLQLLAYEGGQHLTGVGYVSDNAAITKLFQDANRDPRIGTIYREYLQNWFDKGGGLFANFSDIGRTDKSGSWGLLESVSQNSSPKYDAVMDIIHSS